MTSAEDRQITHSLTHSLTHPSTSFTVHHLELPVLDTVNPNWYPFVLFYKCIIKISRNISKSESINGVILTNANSILKIL